jgi:hypothetical protein
MKGKLNLFQATMLRWRELAPYNAVHVACVPLPLDAGRLKREVDGALLSLGLTGLALDASRRKYEFAGGPEDSALRVLAGGQNAPAVLDAEIEREINAPFPADGRFSPFRFFAVDTGAAFHFGLGYDHFVAGGDSIVALIRCIVDRYSGAEADATPRQPLEAHPPTFGRLFMREALRVVRGLPALLEISAGCARSARPRYPGGRGRQNAYASFHVDGATLAAIARVARSWEITRNDLLMAALMQALAPFAGESRHTRRRNEIALVSIVNLRRDFQPGVDATFGQFLSSFRVSHPIPAGIPMREVARDVGAASRRIRRGKLYLQTLIGMSVGSVLWRFLSPARRETFHGKAYPVWAGCTPLNVDAVWREAGGGAPPRDYRRAVSTGPLAPMIVAMTTAGEEMHLGISFRTAAFTREEISRIGDDLLSCLRKLQA